MTYTKATDKDGKDMKGKTLYGLISLDGNTLKVCLHGGQDHPKELHGTKDSGCTLRTYERVKE
ncbi:MAG: hypothetical protein SFV81_06675 [Pirellulaceae bacterium]|nr:hypothetical protein [Pirellulaceae bacterium]